MHRQFKSIKKFPLKEVIVTSSIKMSVFGWKEKKIKLKKLFLQMKSQYNLDLSIVIPLHFVKSVLPQQQVFSTGFWRLNLFATETNSFKIE